MNDYPELAKRAGQHFRKRLMEELGPETKIYDICIDGNIVRMKISAHKDWPSEFVKGIIDQINQEVYEIMNQGIA